MAVEVRTGTIRGEPDVLLRPAGPSDWPAIDRWLAQPEIARWWGSRAAAQATIIAALDAPMGLASILVRNGRDIGYAQALDATAVAQIVPPGFQGCYRIDVFIADRTERGRGFGVAALGLAVDEVFQTTLAPAVFAVVSVRNEMAVRAHEKAGFRWVCIVEDPLLGPSWLLRRDR